MRMPNKNEFELKTYILNGQCRNQSNIREEEEEEERDLYIPRLNGSSRSSRDAELGIRNFAGDT